ncbi:LEM3 family/CDC50 family protein [Phlyctema vagabunda]|uniref:LEM3 family/CDC50 family protein n=1 Tax=Phlyctema vagabunda TaxID=108571 RepID=A0ABR4PLA3_9HELO
MADSQAQMGHEDSISSQDPNNKKDNKVKSRRPANTAFRQQRLKAWQPILTPKTVLPLFFAVGILFAPIGGLLIYSSSQVQEIVIDYTKCYSDAPIFPEFGTMPSGLVDSSFKSSSNSTSTPARWSRRDINATYGPNGQVKVPSTQCSLQFNIPHDMTPPVLFYYKLTNFFQNHRRYVKSFNSDQLKGDAVSASTIDGGDCSPLTTTTIEGVVKPYYPCGIVANSVFNDTFYNPVLLNVPDSNEPNRTYYMTNSSDISWSTDRDLYGPSKYNWNDVAVPPHWVERYPDGYSDEYHPDLENDEPFQVWMRTAGLPTFSKLAQRNNTETLISGNYQVDIDHHFNVTEYGGTKSIIISTRTVTGGKNPFLGIAYVVVAGICVVLGVLFTATHLIKPRKLGDHTYLSWNNDQTGGGATASGREAHGEAVSRGGEA